MAGDAFAVGGLGGAPTYFTAPVSTPTRSLRAGAAVEASLQPAASVRASWRTCALTGAGLGMVVAATGRRSRAARRARGGAFDPAAQLGATEPLGFWDPAGFCLDGKEETFDDLRGKELKHGRVAMIAIVGFLGQGAGWRYPGFEGAPDGLAALQSPPGSTGFAIFFLVWGFFELKIMDDLERGNKPGNFGDPFKMATTKLLGGYDENWRNFELNNGRLAMIGAIGTIVANGFTGLNAYEQWQQGKEASIGFIKTTLPFAP